MHSFKYVFHTAASMVLLCTFCAKSIKYVYFSRCSTGKLIYFKYVLNLVPKYFLYYIWRNRNILVLNLVHIRISLLKYIKMIYVSTILSIIKNRHFMSKNRTVGKIWYRHISFLYIFQRFSIFYNMVYM